MPPLPDSGFDRVASFYDRLARLVYGDALQEAQLALLPFIPDKATVLIIGGGSGWLLEQLLATQKQVTVLYLEAAPAMLRRAQRRYQQYKGAHPATVAFRLGTEQALQPQERFDIILTPFILDLFPPLRLHRLMRRLTGSLVPGGRWLFSDFWPVRQPPPRWQRLLISSMYTFFGILSGVRARRLPNYWQHFEKLGLQEEQSYTFFHGMVQSKVYRFRFASRRTMLTFSC